MSRLVHIAIAVYPSDEQRKRLRRLRAESDQRCAAEVDKMRSQIAERVQPHFLEMMRELERLGYVTELEIPPKTFELEP